MSDLIGMFEGVVAQYPNKVAVADENTSLTFTELLDAAREFDPSELASDGPVIIEVDRTCSTIVRMLGCMYHKRTFVPLDPETPDNKRAAIRSALEGVASSGPLCILFTSGSTGVPKGVVKSEESYVNFIQAYCRALEIGADEVIGNQTPFFFDASSKDVLLMMCTGATLEIIPSGLFVFPIKLLEYLNERKITYTCWVPSAYTIVTQLKTFDSVKLTTLRHAYFVGEQFPLDHLHAWMSELPDVEFVNLYGSTEVAGICCYCKLDTSRTYEALPIGGGLDNCEVFLLDGDRVAAGPGAEGEICVASDTLAEGYLHNAEETAARFVEIETPSGEVRRTLKTGDLARLNDEGELVFKGRSDFQIKHMGRRIELQEIEVKAESLSDVDASCCVYDDRKKKIVMYCTLVEGSSVNARQIKRQLKEHVSPYMVPNKVYVIPEMPLNANGKIDRVELKSRL